jgi:antiviral helicase SKI2
VKEFLGIYRMVTHFRADVNPLPITRLSLPPSSSYRVETYPYTDILTITQDVVKIESSYHQLVESELSKISFDLLQIGKEYDKCSNIPEYDWSKMRELEFQEKLAEKSSLLKSLNNYQCTQCPDLDSHYSQAHSERLLKDQILDLRHQISDQNLELLPEYHMKVNVLKFYKFIEEQGTVQLKGRVACEINTADELLLTEMIFDNFFSDYDAAESVALLSCLVFQEKSQSTPILNTKLEKVNIRIEIKASDFNTLNLGGATNQGQNIYVGRSPKPAWT